MSEILKAKNRIMNRSKLAPSQQPLQQQPNQMWPHTTEPNNEQTFEHQPQAGYNKKFNISSISMKFIRNQEDQPQHKIQRTPNRFDSIKLTSASHQPQDSKRREKSPEFSHTERINPIRHFEPYNLGTLSESNSQSSLYKWSRNKSRRISNKLSDQDFQKKSDLKTTLEKNQTLNNQSPISKIRKTVHTEQLNLIVARLQNKRAQSPYKPKECLKQYTDAFIKQIQQNKKNFQDQCFPPKLTIMFPKKFLYCQEPNLAFQRLAKVYQNMDLEVVLMQKCEPTFLSPGKFTNPCLFSALRILSEYPEKVLSLFQNQKKNDQGIYYVRICKDGTWRYVLVDDWIPVRVQEAQKKNIQILGLSYLDANGVVELWPSLVEKALAKVYGTYWDLLLSRRDGICPLLRALTGWPVSKYDLIKDVRSYLVLVDSALKKGHVVILQQLLPQFTYLAELKGLALEQSYQVLQIQKNAFVLRNLADIDLVTKLTFDQVMMFSSLLIFRKEDNYVYVSQKLRHKKGYFSSMRVLVPANTLCYWDVWQNNPAYYKNHLENRIDYEVAPYKILIQPVTVQSLPQYDSVTEPETIVESGKQISMKKGEYYISVHLCQTMKEMDFTITYYGEKDVCIERVKNQNLSWNQNCCQSAPKSL